MLLGDKSPVSRALCAALAARWCTSFWGRDSQLGPHGSALEDGRPLGYATWKPQVQ